VIDERTTEMDLISDPRKLAALNPTTDRRRRPGAPQNAHTGFARFAERQPASEAPLGLGTVSQALPAPSRW
jgi:hypothetical protein